MKAKKLLEGLESSTYTLDTAKSPINNWDEAVSSTNLPMGEGSSQNSLREICSSQTILGNPSNNCSEGDCGDCHGPTQGMEREGEGEKSFAQESFQNSRPWAGMGGNGASSRELIKNLHAQLQTPPPIECQWHSGSEEEREMCSGDCQNFYFVGPIETHSFSSQSKLPCTLEMSQETSKSCSKGPCHGEKNSHTLRLRGLAPSQSKSSGQRVGGALHMIPLYHMVPAQNPHHSDTPITNSTPSEESPFSSFPPTEWINGEGQWLKIEADWPSDIGENTKWVWRANMESEWISFQEWGGWPQWSKSGPWDKGNPMREVEKFQRREEEIQENTDEEEEESQEEEDSEWEEETKEEEEEREEEEVQGTKIHMVH